MKKIDSFLSEDLAGLLDPAMANLTLNQVVRALQAQLGWERFGQDVFVQERRVTVSTSWCGWPCSLDFRFLQRLRIDIAFPGSSYAEQVFAEAALARLLDARLRRAATHTWAGAGLRGVLGGECTVKKPVTLSLTYGKRRKPVLRP